MCGDLFYYIKFLYTKTDQTVPVDWTFFIYDSRAFVHLFYCVLGCKITSGCLAKELKSVVDLKEKILYFSFSPHHNSTQKWGAFITAHCPKRHSLLLLSYLFYLFFYFFYCFIIIIFKSNEFFYVIIFIWFFIWSFVKVIMIFLVFHFFYLFFIFFLLLFYYYYFQIKWIFFTS